MCPGFDSRTRCHMWVEFVVGSLLCSERFFSGYPSFPLSSKINIFKFQFDLDIRHFSYESLARVIAQALPVFDIKFTFIFTFTFLHDCLLCSALRFLTDKVYFSTSLTHVRFTPFFFLTPSNIAMFSFLLFLLCLM